MSDGLFGNLLGGYVQGVDRQHELARELAAQEFQKAQAAFQQEKFKADTSQWNQDYNFRVKQEGNREQDRSADNVRDLFTRIQGAWKDGASGEQISGTFAPYAQQLGVEMPDVSTWGENPIIAEKRRHNTEMEKTILARVSSAERAKYAKIKTDYVDRLMKAGVPEYDAQYQANTYIDTLIGDGAGMPPVSQEGAGVPMGATSSPAGFDLMGMLSGYTPNAPAMPTGTPQGLTGNYDPTQPLPGVQVKNEYMGQIGALANTRTALNQQAVGLNEKKFKLKLDEFSLTKQEKEEAIKQARLINPLKRQEILQRIADSKSRVSYRKEQIQRQKQNDGFLNDYRRAKTDAARKPEALKEWGMKERVQLETRKSKAQGEWRQNEKMLSDLKQEQNNLLYGKTLEQLTPQERASYDSFQESIEETEAMKEASKADYYQYQQMAKEVGFFKADSPQGLAERGRANPRDLPVQPRNMGKDRAVLPKQQGSKSGLPTIVPPTRGYITPARGSAREKAQQKPAPKATGKKDYSKMTTDELKREYLNRMR